MKIKYKKLTLTRVTNNLTVFDILIVPSICAENVACAMIENLAIRIKSTTPRGNPTD